jgi:putative transposase
LRSDHPGRGGLETGRERGRLVGAPGRGGNIHCKAISCRVRPMSHRVLRNLARRLDQEAPGVATSILEGLDEILTVNRLKLPAKLRRSLACTNSIENMMGTVRRVCRNVKRWRNTAMALRWTAAGMMEAAKGFRRLKAYRLLPILRAALLARAAAHATKEIEPQIDAA